MSKTVIMQKNQIKIVSIFFICFYLLSHSVIAEENITKVSCVAEYTSQTYSGVNFLIDDKNKKLLYPDGREYIIDADYGFTKKIVHSFNKYSIELKYFLPQNIDYIIIDRTNGQYMIYSIDVTSRWYAFEAGLCTFEKL